MFHDLARPNECRIGVDIDTSRIFGGGDRRTHEGKGFAQNKTLNLPGHKFRARGYLVTTVGRDEKVIRAYIRNQELADQQLEPKMSAAPKSIDRPSIL